VHIINGNWYWILLAGCKFIETSKDLKKELRISAGAGFVVAIAGSMLTMPGLPKVPAAEGIDVFEDGEDRGVVLGDSSIYFNPVMRGFFIGLNLI
jgi:hypothetical protein